MDDHYFPFDEASTPPLAGSFNLAIPQEPDKYGLDSFDLMTTDHEGECIGPMPSNYHSTKDFPGWTFPMPQYSCSGSDFTTSPASTTTLGRFSFQDGNKPFDASFGEDVCPESQQKLSDEISSPLNAIHTSCKIWTPPALHFPALINSDPTEFHIPQTKRSNGEVGGANSFSGGHMEELEHHAISLAHLPKRRKTSERSDDSNNLGPHGSDLSLRYNTIQTTRPAPSESPVYRETFRRNSISPAPRKNQDMSKYLEVESKDRRSSSKVYNKEKERHKHVEMKYRKQMKDRFEELLLSLPCQAVSIDTDGKSGVVFPKKIRRGKVLDLAKEHIDMLQRQEHHLLREQQFLQQEVKVYEDAWFGSMGVPGPMY